jgi:hypothetical protein
MPLPLVRALIGGTEPGGPTGSAGHGADCGVPAARKTTGEKRGQAGQRGTRDSEVPAGSIRQARASETLARR